MSIENENIFGPGTDLVISLFSIALILIGIVSGLYLESVNSYAVTVDDKIAAENVVLIQKDKLKELEALIAYKGNDNTQLETTVADLKISNYELMILKNGLLVDLAKEKQQNKKLIAANYKITEKNGELNQQLAKVSSNNSFMAGEINELQKINQELANQKRTLARLIGFKDNQYKSEQLALRESMQKNEKLITKNNKLTKELDVIKKKVRNGIDEDARLYEIEVLGSERRYRLQYQSHEGVKRILTKKEINTLLLAELKKYGYAVHVAVSIPDDFSIEKIKEISCPLWEFDYYTHLYLEYCDGYR